MVPRDIATAFSGLVGGFLPERVLPSIPKTLVGSVTDAFTPNNHQLESFWDMAQKLGPQAGQVVLDEVSKVSSEVANAVVEFKDATTAVVQHAHKLHRDIQDIIEKKGITIEHVSELLSREISEVYENLKDEVNDSLPQDRGEKARARAKLLNQVMEKVQVAYIHVLTEVGLPREETEAHFKNFAPRVVHLMLVIGQCATRSLSPSLNTKHLLSDR
jgi:gas vesicle protein